MMEFVNGKDDIPYMKWKIKHVWFTAQKNAGLGDQYSKLKKSNADVQMSNTAAKTITNHDLVCTHGICDQDQLKS